MKKVLLISLFALIYANCIYSADITYRTNNIAEAITNIGISDIVKKLEPGKTVLKKNGTNICVYINKNRELYHIGIPMFSKMQRQLMPSPIYDFLEYANLAQTFKLQSNDRNHQYITFVKGKWSDLSDIDENAQVEITNIDKKYISVTWHLNTPNKIVEMKFPIMYELISSSTRKELEDNFSKDLRQATRNVKFSPKTLKHSEINDLQLYVSDNDTIYKTAADTLFVGGISNATYYKKNGKEYNVLFDKNYPIPSYANMFFEGIESQNQNITISVRKQDFTKETTRTSVGKLLALLKKQGCKNYMGIRNNDSKNIQFSLYSYNESLGCLHLFIINGTADGLCKEPLQAKAYLYIPTSNIANLYSENTNNNK